MSDKIATERLTIENFAGIDKAEIEFSRMNVFIGPQATGKSVCAKLFYFFRNLLEKSVSFPLEETRPQIKADQKKAFVRYFPVRGWSLGKFAIRYSCGDLWIEVRKAKESGSTIDISYSKLYDDVINRLRRAAKKTDENSMAIFRVNTTYQSARDAAWKELEALNPILTNRPYFIPAGRSFFSLIQSNVFALIAGDADFDPFITEFGRSYEISRKQYFANLATETSVRGRIERRITRLLAGRYVRENGVDFIKMHDGRQISLLYSSSGQQEVLPLAIVLNSVVNERADAFRKSTLIIEEPETHLFPAAQREILHLFTSVIDLQSDDSSSQCIQTTHSPYILSAVNNLIYGGKIVAQSPTKRARVEKVLGGASLLDADKVRAYYFDNGTCRSIIDPDTGLIEAKALDQVSNELAREFEELMNIEFEDKKVA